MNKSQVRLRKDNEARYLETINDYILAFQPARGENVYRHLILLFDYSFDNNFEPLSINQISSQLKCISALLEGDNLSELFPTDHDKVQILVPSVSSDSFVSAVMLIDYLKNRFCDSYSTMSKTNSKLENIWKFNEQILENKDVFTFNNDMKKIEFTLIMKIKLVDKQDTLLLNLYGHHPEIGLVQLPMRKWKHNEDIESYFQSFDREFKAFISICYNLDMEQ